MRGSHRDRVLAEIEALYVARFPAFLRVARGILGDRERALEAVQDGFADAIRSRRSFRGDGPLEAWIWRAVVNAARKAARRPLVEPATERAGSTMFAFEPEAAPLLRALPERQRLVLFLRYYADLDYSSIAAALGIEVGTVSSTIAAAHASIRKALVEVGRDG
jgi:RNA polymerase sigma-70 factor (ECF subfamily)